MVVAEPDHWLLRFAHAASRPGISLVVVLCEIARFGFGKDALEIDAVVRRELLFGAQRGGEKFQVVICSMAITVERTVCDLRGITAVSKNSVLHGILKPVAAAQIFGA